MPGTRIFPLATRVFIGFLCFPKEIMVWLRIFWEFPTFSRVSFGRLGHEIRVRTPPQRLDRATICPERIVFYVFDQPMAPASRPMGWSAGRRLGCTDNGEQRTMSSANDSVPGRLFVRTIPDDPAGEHFGGRTIVRRTIVRPPKSTNDIGGERLTPERLFDRTIVRLPKSANDMGGERLTAERLFDRTIVRPPKSANDIGGERLPPERLFARTIVRVQNCPAPNDSEQSLT